MVAKKYFTEEERKRAAAEARRLRYYCEPGYRERIREQSKRYVENNREKVYANHREYRNKNREEIKRRKTCRIIREHEKEMRDDPQALTATFIRELCYIDCEDGEL